MLPSQSRLVPLVRLARAHRVGVDRVTVAIALLLLFMMVLRVVAAGCAGRLG